MERRLPVGIIGAGVVGPGSEPWEAAYLVARGLAAAGLVILCGGRGGVMEAACKGAADGGGISIALLPTLDPAKANPFATVVLPTDLGNVRNPIAREPSDVSRNRVIASASACLVACGGGPGTANEIKHALAFGRTVFGLAGAPEPEPPAASDPRRLTGTYRHLASPAEAVERVLALSPPPRSAG
jgi:predicted Rossmann-fold nucleotide-binding protein